MAVAQKSTSLPPNSAPETTNVSRTWSLSYSEIQNLEVIGLLKNLQSLSLFSCRRLQGIEPLEKLSKFGEARPTDAGQ